MSLSLCQRVIYHGLETDNVAPTEINERLEQLDFV